MALCVFFTPSAKLDLSEARDHYRGQSEELAEGFVECAQFAVSRIASTPGQFAIVYKKRSAMPAKTVSVCYFFSRSNGTYRDFGNSTWPPQSNDLETQGKIDAGSLLRVACWMFIVVCSNS